MNLINEGAVAKPETVRSKSFPAIVRGGLWVKEMIYLSFPASFSLVHFFWTSKRNEQSLLGKQKNRGRL